MAKQKGLIWPGICYCQGSVPRPAERKKKAWVDREAYGYGEQVIA